MFGCTRISISLHVTIHTVVLIENLKDLSSDLHWWSCKILSTQYHTVDVITHDESAAVFSWKGKSLEEYWNFILITLIYPEDDGKGQRPDQIVDNWGDMTIIVHEGNKA